MPSSSNPIVRRLGEGDAAAVSKLLLADPPDYSRYFHPFDFNLEAVRAALAAAKLDYYFGLRLSSSPNELAGFYMLRGFDQGYKIPMYGVFIAARHSGKGLAQFTLQHAVAFCQAHNIEELRLKVHPDNARAKRLYERQGFTAAGVDHRNSNYILSRRIP